MSLKYCKQYFKVSNVTFHVTYLKHSNSYKYSQNLIIKLVLFSICTT